MAGVHGTHIRDETTYEYCNIEIWHAEPEDGGWMTLDGCAALAGPSFPHLFVLRGIGTGCPNKHFFLIAL